ncbi:FliG C-terminal domain-containing protein [Planctomycetota bacterium]
MKNITRKVRAAIHLSGLDEDLVEGLRELFQEPLASDEKRFEYIESKSLSYLARVLTDAANTEVALLLCVMDQKFAAILLEEMAVDRQVAIVNNMIEMENNDSIIELYDQIVKRLGISENEYKGKTIKELYGSIADMIGISEFESKIGQISGLEVAAEIMSELSKASREEIIPLLNPDTADMLRCRIFVFEDLIMVNDRGLQNMLKQTEHSDLALALKTASCEVKDKILKNISERAADLVNEDIEYLGPVRVADVEQAQQQIVDIIRKLEETGDAIIQGRGGDEDLIE